MIVFSCPDCGKELSVKPELIGKRRKCPYCQSKVEVPASQGASQKTLIGALKSDEARSISRAAKPSRDLPSAANLSPAANTLVGGLPGLKPTRNLNDTLAPDGAALEDPTYELTRFLQPAQAPGELGRLGKYRIVKILGAGGMGVVFQAEDTALKRSVALKALLPSMNSSKLARDRFLREAQSSAALQHENVVTVYEVNEANDVPFLALQLLKGEGLDARLTREGTLPLDDVLRIGQETAEGLAAAHELGLIHRDIKPANLFLVAPKGRVKILDFGLARPVGEDSQLTKFGTVVGTPGYLSPEQASGKPVDARGDLFSLGCVLYRLTTGELPFQGEDMLSMLTALITTTPPAPIEINSEVPASLSDLIVRLLSRKPDDRPGSAREVSDALHAIAVRMAPATMPALALLDDVKPEPRKLTPAAITQTPRGAVKKVETATTDRPARRNRADSDDRVRRPRRNQSFPSWVAWAAGATALLLVGGVTAYFLLRTKEKAPKSAEAEVDKARPKPLDLENPVNPADPAKPDNLVAPLPPLSFAGNHWLAFSPDNQHFVSSAPNGDKIVVWDRSKREPEYVIDRLVGGITQPPHYSSDGKKLIVGIGQSAVVYDVGRKQTAPLCAYAADDVPRKEGAFGHGGVHADRLAGIGFGENDTPLAVFYGHASNKRVLGLFDVERKSQRANGYWFFQDGVVPRSGGIRFDPKGSKPSPDAALKAAMPTPDGRGIIVVDASAMRVWTYDPNPGKGGWNFKKIPSVEQEPKCFALAPDGKTFLTSHGKNEVHIWNAKNGEALKSFTFGNGGEIDLLGFSQDSRLGMCCTRDGNIYVWDADTGTIRAEVLGQPALFSAALSLDLRTAIGSSPAGSNLSWFNLAAKP